MAAKKKTATTVAKEETKTQSKKQLISLEILNTEVLNFIVSIVILALLVFYLVPSTGADSSVAPIEPENNCKIIVDAIKTPEIEFSHVDEKGSCFITREQKIPNISNNQTIVAKIEQEIGAVSSITIIEGIEQPPMMIQ